MTDFHDLPKIISLDASPSFDARFKFPSLISREDLPKWFALPSQSLLELGTWQQYTRLRFDRIKAQNSFLLTSWDEAIKEVEEFHPTYLQRYQETQPDTYKRWGYTCLQPIYDEILTLMKALSESAHQSSH